MPSPPQAAATRAAQAVQVEYADIQQPVVTIPEAIKAGRLVASPFSTGAKSVGDAQGAISSSELSLRGVELDIPSQYHFYMEPQVGTLAWVRRVSHGVECIW